MNRNLKKLSLCLTVSAILMTGTNVKAQENKNSDKEIKMWQKIAYFNKNIRAETELVNILSIALIIKGKYSSVDTYTGLNQTVAIEKEVFPKRMFMWSKVPINSWKGDVIVDAATTSSYKNDNAFTITYKNVPTKACFKLVSNLKDNFNIISVNDKIVKNVGHVFNVKKADEICKKGTEPYNNTIKFTSF